MPPRFFWGTFDPGNYEACGQQLELTVGAALGGAHANCSDSDGSSLRNADASKLAGVVAITISLDWVDTTAGYRRVIDVYCALACRRPGGSQMKPTLIPGALVGLMLAVCVNGSAFAQLTQSTNIPLSYVPAGNEFRLGINVGINGGPQQSYLFDTGSSLFNAAYNPATWNNYGGAGATTVPPATIPGGTNIIYCYGTTNVPGTCRGYVGNLVQIPTLSFDTPGGGTTTFSASGGFQINAVGADNSTGQNPALLFPSYFSTSGAPAPDEPQFYGIFGAGNFATYQSGCSVAVTLPSTCAAHNRTPSILVGGVLGQVSVSGSGITQGYVVAANGMPNQAGSSANPPTGNAQIKIGDTNVQVTSCNPCVTVGLTPQLIGQFAPVGMPGQSPGQPGVVPWLPITQDRPTNFPNPYGATPGNNSALEMGAMFSVSLSPTGGAPSPVTSPTLLDTGTPSILVSSGLSGAGTGATSMSVAGTTTGGAAIPGLATTVSSLNPTPNTSYNLGYLSTNNHIFGLPFFMQNSVMFDLQDRVVGYTPFFVTDNPLTTTGTGPLIVSSSNVWLGLAGAVSGPGGVLIGNGGVVQLSATNTYGGATQVSTGGTLLVSGPGSIQSSSGVANDGSFDISRAWAPITLSALTSTTASGVVYLGSNNLTIANASGTYAGNLRDGGSYPAAGGSLTIAGGTQTLAGTNSYTGGTTVSGGTLALTGTMVGSLTIQPGASFTSTGGYSVASGATLSNSGTFTSTGGAALLNQGALVNNGSLVSSLVNSGSFTNNGTLTGTLTNYGTLSGSGALMGNMTNDGNLAVNGTITGNVTNAGRLSGNGTITGAVANGGIVAPGNSIGTLNVVGTFTQSAGSSYQVEVNPQGQADRVNVSGAPGTTTIAGGTSVYVIPEAGAYAPRTTYTILTATGGVSGTYSTATSSAPFLQPVLSYDAQNIYLTLQAGGFAAAALTPTQAAVGAVLDASAPSATGNYATVVSALTSLTTQQGQAVMTAISGQNYAGFSSAGVQSAQMFMSNFANQAGGGSGKTRVTLAEACDVACDTTAPGWGVWGGAIGGLGTIGGNVPVGGLTYNQGGFAAGIDRKVLPDLLLGVTIGYSAGTQWVSGFQGNGTSNTIQAGLYGSFTPGAFYLDGLAGYAYSANQMQRPIAIPGLASMTAVGQTGANQFFGQLEAGYRVELGGNAGAYVTPFARLQGATSTQNAFTENGAGALNLSVAAQTTNSLRSVLGAQLGGSMDMGWRDKLALQLRLGWSHEYADTGRPVTAAFAGAPALAFTTYGVSPQRDGVLLGFSANTAVADSTSLYFRYEGDFSGADSSHALTAGVRLAW
ncbi:autotransporter domain-containing protein [Reyranella sp.]|uniref:autotransporter outer membrane beta-barrel domain-containing protein n=1 Tax=Reyranella sp. TaxID=1929291 RepID=UPI0027307430|nr:autotransporter outer membrane beta-barrel domain-containing protein [Reyranella sp.]